MTDEMSDFEGQLPQRENEKLGVSFQVLSREEVAREMERNIVETKVVTHLPTGTVRCLLNRFKWDKEHVLEHLYLDNSIENPLALKIPTYPLSSTMGFANCEICFARTKSACLSCGHVVCSFCLGLYLAVKIMNEASDECVCPAQNCKVIIEDHFIQRSILSDKIKEVYRNRIVNSFVEFNRLIKWCPAQNCTFAVKVKPLGIRIISR